MGGRAEAVAAIAILGLAIISLMSMQCSALQVGFYNGKCGPSTDVEAVVASVVQEKFPSDLTITAALLRLQFHDCFVNGCDASILLDGSSSEKTAPPNLSVRGYDVIDAIKTKLEELCPGLVSCADIIVMATRDAVALSTKKKSGGGQYIVETGRQDGLVSQASLVNLPSPSISVPQSIAMFASKGLNVTDMVYLLGGHTVGIAHCSLFQDRLYNFQNTGKPDPSMDAVLASSLRSVCPQDATVDNSVNLDQNPSSSSVVDNSYYSQIEGHRGILQIDQQLALDSLTSATVSMISNSVDFSFRFGQAMIKLGTLQSGSPGEIRKFCRVVNSGIV